MELNELQNWFEKFIKQNKRELLYVSIVLVESIAYRIETSMEMNSNIHFRMYNVDTFLSLQYVSNQKHIVM